MRKKLRHDPTAHIVELATEQRDLLAERQARVAQAKLFVLLQLVTLLATVLLVAYRARAVSVIPYIVQIGDDGHAVAVAPATTLDPAEDALVNAQVVEVIRSWRTALVDAEAQEYLRDFVLARCEGSARRTVDAHWSSDPEAFAEREATIVAEIRSVASSGTRLDVSWTELRNERGSERRSDFVAAVTVRRKPFGSLAELTANPLGVVLERIEVTRQ